MRKHKDTLCRRFHLLYSYNNVIRRKSDIQKELDRLKLEDGTVMLYSNIDRVLKIWAAKRPKRVKLLLNISGNKRFQYYDFTNLVAMFVVADKKLFICTKPLERSGRKH
jgi:hypothetical protein